jgi:putative acyl-CoA dehydrogenase
MEQGSVHGKVARKASNDGSNQTPALIDYNLFDSDPVLVDAVLRENAGGFRSELAATGNELGRADNFDAARLANQYGPVLRTHDARGVRIDEVEFHPAWHALLSAIARRRLHNRPWSQPGTGAHVARAAAYFMQTQIESGTLCPTTMTYGAIAAMRRDANLARDWLPTLLSDQHDARNLPLAAKAGGMIGMGMTEKQGGSDVRANTTRATRVADGSYRLLGHKWFFSAPQCDAHLVLAQSESGLSCFFVPRYTPEDKKNGVLIQRLKDKLGNRSNASAEVEFDHAYATLLGEPGRGIPTILEMGTFTRLDCVTGTAGLMRQALAHALNHARHRSVFGKPLVEQPLMQSVLADLCLESAGATVLALRLARAFDAPEGDEHEAAIRRIMTPVAKFWVCKRGPELAAEAMEVLGGNGYVEELALARIYREMPVNSIWEGSGNVMCLDLLRGLSRYPASVAAIEETFVRMKGRDALFDQAYPPLLLRLAGGGWPEAEARHLAWRLVSLFCAALLLDSGLPPLATAFCQTRLSPRRGSVFGSFEGPIAAKEIIAASWREK